MECSVVVGIVSMEFGTDSGCVPPLVVPKCGPQLTPVLKASPTRKWLLPLRSSLIVERYAARLWVFSLRMQVCVLDLLPLRFVRRLKVIGSDEVMA